MFKSRFRVANDVTRPYSRDITTPRASINDG